jgi:hypothetical protein
MSDDRYDEGYDEGEADARRDADAAYQEGYDEGYTEGQQEIGGLYKQVFNGINKWLEERGVLKWEDFPDGLSYESMMELIYDHERSLVLKAKQSVMN